MAQQAPNPDLAAQALEQLHKVADAAGAVAQAAARAAAEASTKVPPATSTQPGPESPSQPPR